MSISTNDLKNGMALNLPEGLMTVVEFQHVKPGKGGAFVRTKLKNFRTGAVLPIHDGRVLGVELPAAVELAVTDTEPGVQGDRVSGARKPATLETGLVVQVPLFVEPGDTVKVDTRTGEYLARV